jgi:hypothetical protein
MGRLVVISVLFLAIASIWPTIINAQVGDLLSFLIDPEVMKTADRSDVYSERTAITLGQIDYRNRRTLPRKKLLCVSFIKAFKGPLDVLLRNMYYLGDQCEWAVVFYDGPSSAIQSFCGNASTAVNYAPIEQNGKSQSLDHNNNINKVSSNVTVVHCRRAPDTINRPKVFIPTSTDHGGVGVSQLLSTPKSVLYKELLPVLPFYERVFLMDEDIFLQGFRMKLFLRILKCSFPAKAPPLIVQPLILGSSQYFPYVNSDTWQKIFKRTSKSVSAASVGLVEQQVPMFHAQFFEWFIRRVLSQTETIAAAQGVDQTHDRTWCRAADAYAQQVLNITYSFKIGQACAVIIGDRPNLTVVQHLNTRSLENKKANRAVYRKKAADVLDKYKYHFPSWVVDDIKRSVSPIDSEYGRRYRKFAPVSPSCPA